MFGSRFEVPWSWERESRGQQPESLQKVSKKSPGVGRPGPGSQKSEKGLEKGPKSLQNPLSDFFFWTFRAFFETFFRTFQPVPGRLFRDFARLLGFGLRDSLSQVHGTSILGGWWCGFCVCVCVCVCVCCVCVCVCVRVCVCVCSVCIVCLCVECVLCVFSVFSGLHGLLVLVLSIGYSWNYARHACFQLFWLH